jgi:rfaE bifunctional protein nucleotidyltransferase chain/domain
VRDAACVLKSKVWALPVERPTGIRLGQVVLQAELISRRGGWKHAGLGVVCASGCFDLLHPGHIRLLEYAKSLGKILVVAIEGDRAARARFGNGNAPHRRLTDRPIHPGALRAEILAALAAVDFVTAVESGSPQDFIARFLPDVVVLGGSAGTDPAARRDAGDVERPGCRVVRVPLEPGYSTTRLIERIQELRA